MEKSGQMKLTRMYEAIDRSTGRLCNAGSDVVPCEVALALYPFLAQIELGYELNRSAEFTSTIKHSERQATLKK